MWEEEPCGCASARLEAGEVGGSSCSETTVEWGVVEPQYHKQHPTARRHPGVARRPGPRWQLRGAATCLFTIETVRLCAGALVHSHSRSVYGADDAKSGRGAFCDASLNNQQANHKIEVRRRKCWWQEARESAAIVL